MAQYINKDALVAEIERRIADVTDECNKSKRPQFTLYGKINALENLLPFIDTLEVKEVDLDREMQAFALLYLEPLKISDSNIGISITMAQLYSCAKHFFELGLRSTITEEDCKLVWNIGDKIPYMPEEEFFKELLKRYKAQKGE